MAKPTPDIRPSAISIEEFNRQGGAALVKKRVKGFVQSQKTKNVEWVSFGDLVEWIACKAGKFQRTARVARKEQGTRDKLRSALLAGEFECHKTGKSWAVLLDTKLRLARRRLRLPRDVVGPWLTDRKLEAVHVPASLALAWCERHHHKPPDWLLPTPEPDVVLPRGYSAIDKPYILQARRLMNDSGLTANKAAKITGEKAWSEKGVAIGNGLSAIVERFRKTLTGASDRRRQRRKNASGQLK